MSSRYINGRTKVMRIITRLNIGGPAIHVTSLNAGLDSAHFDSLLVFGSELPEEGSLKNLVQSTDIRAVVIPQMSGEATLRPRDVVALFKLWRLMRRERPTIVHTHTGKAGLLGRLAARLAGVPIVLHTYHGHVLHSYYGPVKSRLLRLMERSLAVFTDRVVAVSPHIKRDLLSYGVTSEKKIVVVPLGLDLRPFLCSDAQRGSLRQALNLDNRAPLVGIVGRIFPVKNHRLFLEAAARVAETEPRAHFVVVGDGTLRSDMERYSNDLGIADRVAFTGWRRDLPGIYDDLDVLVVSSDNEGTPLSAIEAMASSCPVVATRVGGLPDLIKDGETGYLVPPRDPDAMATAIMRVLSDTTSASHVRQSARKMVEETFPVERLVADIHRLYEELLAEKAIAPSRHPI